MKNALIQINLLVLAVSLIVLAAMAFGVPTERLKDTAYLATFGYLIGSFLVNVFTRKP